MNAIWQDVRYGLRMLGKGPVFTAVAVATLALAIGANTAIISIGRSVLHPPVPYAHPQRLAAIWNKDLKRGYDEMMLSVPDLMDYERQASSFEAMSGFTWTDYKTFSISSGGSAERFRGLAVLPGLFRVVEMHPLLGREFSADEFVGEKHVVMLGYDVWRSKFGADAGLVGRTIRLNHESYEVVGILPKNFEIPVMDGGLEVVVPLRLDGPDTSDRKQRLVVGAGLLKPGQTLAEARAELDGTAKRLAAEHPEDVNLGGNVEGLEQIGGLQDAKAQLPIFLATVLLMMLVAAANVAGILLSRFAARNNELAVRSALGASRARLLRQLVTESVLLASLAGLLAIIVAQWAGDLLISYRPFYMPSPPEHVLTGTAMAVIVALSLVVGVAFGLLPAFNVAGKNLHEVMNRVSTRIGAGWRSDGLRNALVGAEVALSVVLLVGAGLMVNTVVRIARVNIGFDSAGIALGRVSLDGARYAAPPNQIAFYQSLVERLASEPGVKAATATSHFPSFDPSGWTMGAPVRVPGRTAPEKMGGPQIAVMPNFFAAMGMPILRGRGFKANEPEPVMVVDETFARMIFPNEDPVGKQVELMPTTMRGDGEVKPGLRTIIGVVPSVRRIAYWAKPWPQAYLPYAQNPVASMYAMVRTPDDSGGAVIRRAVGDLDPELPVYWPATMKSWIGRFYGSQRFQLVTLAAFAIVALLISASGLYAVISYRVAQRTRELGVRLALGARPRNVQWIVLRQAGTVIAMGIIAGLAGAGAIGQVLAKFLYGVRPRDPLTIAAGAVLVLLISVVAAYVPARRASQLDPLVALRYE